MANAQRQAVSRTGTDKIKFHPRQFVQSDTHVNLSGYYFLALACLIPVALTMCLLVELRLASPLHYSAALLDFEFHWLPPVRNRGMKTLSPTCGPMRSLIPRFWTSSV
jgi:hypothetical protein